MRNTKINEGRNKMHLTPEKVAMIKKRYEGKVITANRFLNPDSEWGRIYMKNFRFRIDEVNYDEKGGKMIFTRLTIIGGCIYDQENRRGNQHYYSLSKKYHGSPTQRRRTGMYANDYEYIYTNRHEVYAQLVAYIINHDLKTYFNLGVSKFVVKQNWMKFDFDHTKEYGECDSYMIQ